MTAGETLTIVVGEGGKNPFSQTIIYSGGGHNGYYAGNGGGRSRIPHGARDCGRWWGGRLQFERRSLRLPRRGLVRETRYLSASAPPMISMSSLVIAAWRARL